MNNQCANKLLKLIEEPPQKTIIILIVEDDSEVRNFTKEALDSRGYVVLEATNGIEALEILGMDKQLTQFLLFKGRLILFQHLQ